MTIDTKSLTDIITEFVSCNPKDFSLLMVAVADVTIGIAATNTLSDVVAVTQNTVLNDIVNAPL